MLKKLIGKKIIKIEEGIGENLLTISTDNGSMNFYHYQDCCETVWLEDGLKDLEKMIGEIVLQADIIESHDDGALNQWDESYTWTYYKISTLHNDCTLRFYGTSNGYYSESVDIEWVEGEK